MIFDWQAEVWRQLQARRFALPHALLFRGPKGIGKRHLAKLFGRALVCETPQSSGFPCQTCLACRWTDQGTHPDLRVVEPDALSESDEEPAEPKAKSAAKAPSTQIRIAQIRELQDWVVMSSHRNGLRVALLAPAEAMNHSTANALLKTLEEPPPRTLIMLIANDASKLLPTIISRCQRIDLALPDRSSASAWLEKQGLAAAPTHLALASGAPLEALENPARREVGSVLVNALEAHYAEPLQLAAAVKDLPVLQVVDLLQKWAFDLIATSFGMSPRYYIDHGDKLSKIAARLDAMKLLAWTRALGEARSLATHPLNARLVFEQLFQGYRDAFALGR
jgi:DNA polymerase III subunit delta'